MMAKVQKKFNAEEKKYLLSLARRSIKSFLDTGNRIDVDPSDVPSERLSEDGACFVTLHIGTDLRGCIGSLEAHRPLVMDVADNAVAAAFGDPRFYPLTTDEFAKVKISISVLTKPECLPVKDSDDLLKKLKPGKHGLIMERGTARATFLPAVWEQLPGKEEFMEHLSLKACLARDGWKSVDCRFFVYEAEEFSE